MIKRKLFLTLFVALTFSGCSFASRVLNPFYEPPSELGMLGEANDNALNSSGLKEDNARKALEQMATYQEAHTPSPVKPVVQPSVVRLMWVPDHLNSHGDLVPAHYYYLKVLKDRWAVSDAFELEGQLNKSGKIDSNIPYVTEGALRR